MGWFILAGLFAVSDLLIKHTINQGELDTVPKKCCKGKVTLTKVYNKGALLGILKGNTKKLFGISLVCIGIITGMLIAVSGQKKNCILKLGLSMLLGGAGSNLYERYTKGKVTDYIKFNVGGKRFQKVVFNIGDFFIFIGSFFTFIGLLKQK